VAGLTVGHLLRDRFAVTLFEQQRRLGGNAYTFQARDGTQVDIAVAAFGRAGYPHFFRLVDRLGLSTRACASSWMSFHDLDRDTGLYMTPSWRGVLAQRGRILAPGSLGAFLELASRLRRARRLLDLGALDGLTVAAALERLALRRDARIVLLCTFSLLSSMDTAEILEAPARFFFAKLCVHHDVASPRALLSVRALDGRTRLYVDALSAGYRVQTAAPVRRVTRRAGHVILELADGRHERFDRVVLACNPDQALALLADPTPLERELLGAWRMNEERVAVHRDHAAFPRRALVQAYTFLYTERHGQFTTSVNGALWHEPRVPPTDLVSSQRPNFPIRDDLLELDTRLRTPVFDARSCATTERLPALHGTLGTTWYCGSWFGYGLHEDAVRSAAAVARDFGVEFWR
jgi:predicted NAD/FAD-binding protein